MRGTLFLVVGPSGAGKDSLISAARAKMESTGSHLFPQRTITRREKDPNEDHTFENSAAFERHERDGAFALSWRAHGLAYGIPSAIEDHLARGTHVVVNVSRVVVDEARGRFAPVRAIEVTAPAHVLAARLKARGRESEPQVLKRVARTVTVASDVTIVNDGTPEQAVAAFLAALSKVES